MAHHRKKHPGRRLAGDKNTSEWKYPQVEKGNRQRSRYATAKWAARCNDQMKEIRKSMPL